MPARLTLPTIRTSSTRWPLTSSCRGPTRVFANLKTWALGVYHSLRQQHLQSYLDEFTFRFNRRRSRHPAFRSLLAIAVAKTPATYNMLIKPEATA